MKTLKLMIFVLIMVITTPLIISNEPTNYAVKGDYVVLSPQEYAKTYADQYNVSSEQLIKVMKCESNFDPEAYNGSDQNGGSFGIMQFQKSTFYSYSKKLEIENPDIKNVEQQIKVSAYMFSLGQSKQWSCSRKLGIGGKDV
jgi:soluble lytic murein transglycosylase-like protein